MSAHALSTLIGVRLPLVQAPMAGSQGAALALAVCAAGGLGSLPAAMLTPEALQAELQRLRREAAGVQRIRLRRGRGGRGGECGALAFFLLLPCRPCSCGGSSSALHRGVSGDGEGEQRRPELKAMFAHYMYGEIPPKPSRRICKTRDVS